MNVKYTGAFLDYSGYGEAIRHDILALHSAGIGLSTQLLRFTTTLTDYGYSGNIAKKYQDNAIDYDVNIIHTTPNIMPRYIEDGKYNIGRVFWETDKLPKDFSEGVRDLQEIWTGSEFTKQSILNAGIDEVPIYIIPEAIEKPMADIQPFTHQVAESFAFYSIFEWTERKNPRGLIEAFYNEFDANSDVALVIKTYITDFTNKNKNKIKSDIKQIKKKFQGKNLPPIYLYTHLMNRHQIYRFHQTFDCFISLSRGEGWGIPIMEAGIMGKPIITTKCGGITEYLRNDVDAKLVDTKLCKVDNDANQRWYQGDQNWFDCSMPEVGRAMRKIYEDETYRDKIAKIGQKKVLEKFTAYRVGGIMKQRLLEI